jgi:hypothetical protein
MIKKMNKMTKKLDIWDIGLTKLTVFAGALFLVGIWPAFASWVMSVNPWWFLAAFVVLSARPFARFYGK